MFAVAFPPSQGDRRPPSCLISLCIKFETSNQNHTWVSGSALLFPYRAAPLSIHGHSLLSVAQTIHLGGHTDSSLIPHIQTIRISSWHDHKTDPEFDLSSLLPLLQLWSVSPLSLTWNTAITSYEITLVPPPLYHLFTKQPECSFQTSRQSCYSSTQQKTCPSPWLPLSKYKSYYDGL